MDPLVRGYGRGLDDEDAFFEGLAGVDGPSINIFPAFSGWKLPRLRLKTEVSDCHHWLRVDMGQLDGDTNGLWSPICLSWRSSGFGSPEVYRECIYECIESWNCSSIHVARRIIVIQIYWVKVLWYFMILHDTSNILQLSIAPNDQAQNKNGWFTRNNDQSMEGLQNRMKQSCHLRRFERSRFALRMLHDLPGFDVGWLRGGVDGACIEH